MKPVEILRPATWVRYKPSLCKGCWAGCCTLPVQVSPEDLFHMGYLRADQVEGPLKRIANRLRREGIIQSYNARKRTFTLQQKNGHDCIFLDEDRLCTIYEKRPYICRRFPETSARPGVLSETEKIAQRFAKVFVVTALRAPERMRFFGTLAFGTGKSNQKRTSSSSPTPCM